jgi:type I restriction enzyme R subunit
MQSPEELAREKIDKLLSDCGWIIQNRSTKTYTAVNFVYRVIKLAGARRVLFLVDRGNLGDQTLIPPTRDQQFVTSDDGRKFTELYNVQHLQSAQLDRVSRVCISTIQRLYSMLRSFFFWDRNTDAARRDQSEETGDTFRVLNNACGAKVSNALAS